MDTLIELLNSSSVLCLATSGEQGPHATPLFYAYRENPLQLIFLSDPKTRHMKEIHAHPQVSAGISPEPESLGGIRGIQLWGTVEFPSDPSVPSTLYFKRFPQARFYHRLHPQHRFAILEVKTARLIDNRLGFANKKEWQLISERGTHGAKG